MSERGAARHRARERALEILYEADIKARPVAEILNSLALAPDPYCRDLVLSADQHRIETHELITRYSQDWPLERIAVVDRLILTLAMGEIRMIDSPPRAVVLDEAVELAKTFSTEGSGSFVNGLLVAMTE
ncbi:MAG: transcription antitermination factor NusB [Acidobacteria bacterium]|nr:transcription antitermination factor NusB [Acidobacteriota bacterium]